MTKRKQAKCKHENELAIADVVSQTVEVRCITSTCRRLRSMTRIEAACAELAREQGYRRGMSDLRRIIRQALGFREQS